MSGRAVRWQVAVSFAAIVCACQPTFGGELQLGTGVAEQLLAASQQALTAERAARLAERAAQKIGDAVRAERRAAWLQRSAEELRSRGGREYLAARRGAELARRERSSIVVEARNVTRAALEVMDALLETPAALERAVTPLPRDLVSLSERVAERAAGVRRAALSLREALLELQAVQLRLELGSSQLGTERGQRLEELLARRRAALATNAARLVESSEALTQAAEDLQRATALPPVQAQMRLQAPPDRLWGLGIGIGFNVDVGGKTRIDTARLVTDPATGGQVVRVDRSVTEIPRVTLEAHYLLPLGGSNRANFGGVRDGAARCERSPGSGCPTVEGARFGIGPFVAVQPGSDFIDAVGAGLMLGLRMGALFPSDRAFLGIGYFADPNTRVLGDGFAADRPPPANETQVRFKDVTKSGILMLISYGF